MKKIKTALPKKVMRDLAERAQLLGPAPSTMKPGEYYKSLGILKRKVLEDLKSEDIADVRWMPPK